MKFLIFGVLLLVNSCHFASDCIPFEWHVPNSEAQVYKVLYNYKIEILNEPGVEELKDIINKKFENSKQYIVLSQRGNETIDLSLISIIPDVLSLNGADKYEIVRAVLDKNGNIDSKSVAHDYKNLFTIFFKLGCFSKDKGIYTGIDYTPLNQWNIVNTIHHNDNKVSIIKRSPVKCSFKYDFNQSYLGGVNNDSITYNLRLIAYSDYLVKLKKWEFFYGYIDINIENRDKERKEYIMGLIPTENNKMVELHNDR